MTNYTLMQGGCECTDGSYWSVDLSCCVSVLECLIYDSSCNQTNFNSNNTRVINLMASMNITIWEDIEALQQEMPIEDYVCPSSAIAMVTINNELVSCLAIIASMVVVLFAE